MFQWLLKRLLKGAIQVTPVEAGKSYLWRVPSGAGATTIKFLTNTLAEMRPRERDFVADERLQIIPGEQIFTRMDTSEIQSKTALLDRLSKAIGNDFSDLGLITVNPSYIEVKKYKPMR